MSIEAITWVMKTSIPDGTAKLVAMVLADYADPLTGMCWPKMPTLAKQCSQSERTVQRKLRLLEELDLLHAVPFWGPTGKQEANRYVLHLPGVPRPPRGDGTVTPPVADPARRGDRLTPLRAPDGCQPVTPGGDTAVTPIETPPSESPRRESPQPPVAGGSRSASRLFRGNPGANPVRPPPVERRPPAERCPPGAALDDPGRQRFERLWAAYPAEGLGYTDRQAAERLFAGLSEADQALAITAAAGYRAQLARTSGSESIRGESIRGESIRGQAVRGQAVQGQAVRAKALQGWLRQRRFTNLIPVPPASTPATTRIFVREGGDAWAAWEAFERAQGRVPRTARWSDTERANGWWFPSALPPAIGVAA